MIDQVRDTLRRASKVVDAPRRRTEEAVRKMAENPNFDLLDAPQLAIDLLKRGRDQAGKARDVLDREVRRGLSTLGLATRDEIDHLNARIAELESAVAVPAHVEAEVIPEPEPAPGPAPEAASGPEPAGTAARARPRPARPRPARPKPAGGQGAP